MSATTILVTGGAGFVGSWVVRRLLEAVPEAEIAVLDNLRNGRREFLPENPRLTFYTVDLQDANSVRELVDSTKPQRVIHLAALHFIPYCNAHPAETMQVNVVGTQNLLEALRAQPPKSMVAASSAAVYPTVDVPNCEGDSAGPTDIYGLSKWINEEQLRLFAQQVPTRCVAARLFNLYGPHETNPHVIPEILDQIAKGHIDLHLGNVKPKRDYVYVGDAAEALVTLAVKNEHSCRAYNVGTGQEYSVEEVVAELGRIAGKSLTIRVSSDRVRKTERMHLLCDRRRIEKEMGWKPRHTLEAGLRELWQYELRGRCVELTAAACP